MEQMGFPSGSAGKESACNAGDLGSVPGLGRSPGQGKGYLLQYSGRENSIDCLVPRGRKESDTTERHSLATTSRKMRVRAAEVSRDRCPDPLGPLASLAAFTPTPLPQTLQPSLCSHETLTNAAASPGPTSSPPDSRRQCLAPKPLCPVL